MQCLLLTRAACSSLNVWGFLGKGSTIHACSTSLPDLSYSDSNLPGQKHSLTVNHIVMNCLIKLVLHDQRSQIYKTKHKIFLKISQNISQGYRVHCPWSSQGPVLSWKYSGFEQYGSPRQSSSTHLNLAEWGHDDWIVGHILDLKGKDGRIVGAYRIPDFTTSELPSCDHLVLWHILLNSGLKLFYLAILFGSAKWVFNDSASSAH